MHIFQGHTAPVFTAVFHPDGLRIASGGRDRVIRIWDPSNGEEMAHLPGHTNYVFSLAFSPDGSTLVSGSGDHTVRLWETNRPAQRLLARQEQRLLQPDAERLVDRLSRKLQNPDLVSQRLKEVGTLSPALREAAWNALIRRNPR